LQNIKIGSRRFELDTRVEIDEARDVIYIMRMPSAFFEKSLHSLLVWHKVDTVIVTGGSISGCVRASVVVSLSRGYRTIVPEECVADKHEVPHFANLAGMLLKCADVVPVAKVIEHLEGYITGHDDVWCATGREIAARYKEHNYDQAVSFIEASSRRGD